MTRYLNGLATMDVVLNPVYAGEWPLKIGQFILNFGALELLSYQYLVLLESSPTAFNKNLNSLFATRVDRVTQLLSECDISEQDKLQTVGLWNQAKGLAFWRNRIAHNPILPTWKKSSDSDKKPPDVLGIPDMKQLKKQEFSDSIPIAMMNKLIDDTAALAQSIHERLATSFKQ